MSAVENHRSKIERLQDELKQAQATFEEFEKQRALLVGTAALRYARRNSEFGRQLAGALRAEVKVKADRAIVADLMTETVTETSEQK